MKGMIFAAGLGTRLKPLTDAMPKALVPVNGTPLLGILIRKMRQSGVDDITVNVHHFPDMIVSYLEKEGLDVHVSDERDALLETGGGLRKARRWLEGGGDFLVHNVDILSNLDFRSFCASAREKQDAVATLAVSDRPSSRKLLFDSGMRLKGWMNLQTSEVRSPLPDLDPSSCIQLAFSGIHMISDRIFPFLETRTESAFSITDFYVSNADRIPVYGVVPEGLKVLDVGKIDSVAVASAFLDSDCRELP